MNTIFPSATGRRVLSLIIGIDPGLDGAISFVDERGGLYAVLDMPTLQDGPKNRRKVNAALLHAILTETPGTPADGPHRVAFVEQVSSRPGEGVSSAFSFGRSVGIVEGVLASLGIPIFFITSSVWKRSVGLPSGSVKDASRSAAIARWPSHAEDFKRVKDDGRADAALIAVAGLIRAGHFS
jgi:crossover junction endodeoxyribonuclease RuvC